VVIAYISIDIHYKSPEYEGSISHRVLAGFSWRAKMVSSGFGGLLSTNLEIQIAVFSSGNSYYFNCLFIDGI